MIFLERADTVFSLRGCQFFFFRWWGRHGREHTHHGRVAVAHNRFGKRAACRTQHHEFQRGEAL